MILWKQTNLDMQCLLLGAACWSWTELRVLGTCSNLCLRGTDWVSPSVAITPLSWSDWWWWLPAWWCTIRIFWDSVLCSNCSHDCWVSVWGHSSLRDNASGSTAMQMLYNHQLQKSCTHHPLVLEVSTVWMYLSSVKWLLATWSG